MRAHYAILGRFPWEQTSSFWTVTAESEKEACDAFVKEKYQGDKARARAAIARYGAAVNIIIVVKSDAPMTMCNAW